ncbi:hypothetical protein [Paludisphaera rhizosphaerae]|uniref:hypothetical protein n=1 Tax=Paludisphaera rhizosphaerae TaxID=2711216 RepID=UPI0013ED7E2F|nr:hypothetical protein [Paludisphaera rhizosphaerae]
MREAPNRGIGRRMKAAAITWIWMLVCGAAPGVSPGQAVAPTPAVEPAQEPADVDDSKGETQPLSLRYRFVERYAETADPAHPNWLTQYQVGVREKLKETREKAQGAPDKSETTLQTIYTERALKTTPNHVVTDVVRRYDRVNLTTSLADHRPFKNPGFLERLTLWYRLRPGRPVELSNLSNGRILRQMEFDRITQNPFLPQLATLLPTTPRRVGDRWAVPRGTIAVLFGEVPLDEGYEVEAELTDVRAAGPGSSSMTAVLAIKGQLVMMEGPLSLNAEIEFAFDAPPADAPAAPAAPGQPKPRPGVVEAEGWISKIRMAQVVTLPVPGDETGRLNLTRTRELIVERRARPSELGTEAAMPIPVPEAPPEDEAHTWVVYDDHQGRFHFAHPQNLRVVHVYPDGSVDLLDRRPDGQDAVSINFIPKTGDPSRDRVAADPNEHRRDLVQRWRAQGQEVQMGDSGWLKEADWSPLHRKVYRLEAALKPTGEQATIRGDRLYADYYVVQFTRDQNLVVTALTARDLHVPFREQAEGVIKSFTFGPSDAPVQPGSLPSPTGTAAETAPAPSP